MLQATMQDQATAIWFSLGEEERELHKTLFIELLGAEYHRRFFRSISALRLIEEVWFRQYLESIYFETGKAA